MISPKDRQNTPLVKITDLQTIHKFAQYFDHLNKSALRHEVAYPDCPVEVIGPCLDPGFRRCDPMEVSVHGAPMMGMKPS